ncbi:MAG: MATE family efflux transporter, partial [Muribaculaceae bacterium]|nr:MATE family efflux transporter [Muribaculaceae bacterium]
MNRQILKLATPAIVSNVTVPLLGLSDTAISGHLGSAVYIAAISVGSMMIALSFGVLNFLRMGTSGMTAVAYGKNDEQGIREVFSGSLMLALLLGGLLIAFQKPLLAVLMYIVGPDAEVRELASTYFRICVTGMPALLGTMVVSGWFVGMQSTFWPMVISISVNVLNIVMSFLLVFPLEVGFAGVAYGTLTANCVGLVLALVLAWRMAPSGGLWCGWHRLLRVELFKRFFAVNSNIFFRSLCVMSVTLSVSAFGARLGSLTLATNAVIVQFFIFFSYFMDGFAFTGEALCGRYYGAGDGAGLRKTVKYLLLWSGGIAIGFFAVYSVGWHEVTGLLTDNAEVRESVARYHVWIQLIPPFAVLSFINDGFFNGITST